LIHVRLLAGGLCLRERVATALERGRELGQPARVERLLQRRAVARLRARLGRPVHARVARAARLALATQLVELGEAWPGTVSPAIGHGGPRKKAILERRVNYCTG